MCSAVALLFVWIALSGNVSLSAQNRVGRPGLLDPISANPLLQLQQRTLESMLQNGLVALEGAVDPAEYRVGPGDQFSYTIGGSIPIQGMTAISIDGNLVLPEVGSIPAAGRTLETVTRDALAALQVRFRNVPVEVSLVQSRLFYVHISGAVPEPGRYLMLPISRVDDVLQQAYASRAIERPDPQAEGMPRIITSATSERPALQKDFRPALRNVQITHRDGTQQQIDLIRYYTTGNTEDNPYLLDGDVVMVPSYHVRRDAVLVAGEVAFPGVFDARPDDTVLDLLTLAAGPAGLPALGQVRLTRTRADGTTTVTTLDVQALLNGAAENAPVLPGDHLNILPREIAMASIQGRVNYPGTFRIQNGETTLRELVEMAGGLKPDANLRAAFLERRKSLDFRESGRASDLDFFSRTYVQSFVQQQDSRVIVDIAAALQADGGEDIVLYDDDRAVFPRDEGTVFVMGNVPQSGYVEYAAGQPARYYIDRAGGKGPDSQTVYVFEDGTGQIRVGEDSPVRSGDTVFVDREAVAESPQIAQLLLQDQMSRRQSRILTTQTVIAGLSAITGIITAFVAVRSINR